MNRLMMTTTSLLAGTALLLGGAAAANAATPVPSSPSSSSAGSAATSCTFGEHLLSAFRAEPKAIRADLKAARAEKPGTRRKDLQAIKAKALAGGYGAAAESKAKFLQSHKGDLQGIRPLPAALTADLKTLHSEKGKTAKLAEANTIADKALAGGYGAKLQTLANDVKASNVWQDCTPGVTGS